VPHPPPHASDLLHHLPPPQLSRNHAPVGKMKISKATTMVGTPKEDDCGELVINEGDEALEAMKKGQQVE